MIRCDEIEFLRKWVRFTIYCYLTESIFLSANFLENNMHDFRPSCFLQDAGCVHAFMVWMDASGK